MKEDEGWGTFLTGKAIPFRRNEPLSKYTTFKVGGPASYLVEPRTTDELASVVKKCRAEGERLYVLGGGSNLIVRDEGVNGIVIRTSSLKSFAEDGKGGFTVGCGYQLSQIVHESLDKGFSGLEALTGIPGSVGGAVRMNAGGKYGEIGGMVRSVEVIGDDGAPRILEAKELRFGYRSSNLKERVISSVTLRLGRESLEAARESYRKIMEEKRGAQPFGTSNAGCTFKNPPGGKAGRLIDEAGLKGAKIGRARVSELHANFLINEGGCSADDLLKLITQIQERVAEKSGVSLELEVVVW